MTAFLRIPFLILLAAAVGVSACNHRDENRDEAPAAGASTDESGSEDEADETAATPTPSPEPEPPLGRGWQTVRYVRETDAIDPFCLGPNGIFFTLNSDGTFLNEGCNGRLEGVLTTAEQNQLRPKLDLLLGSDFGVIECDRDFVPHAPIEVTLTRESVTTEIYGADLARGECTRGNEAGAVDLRTTLDTLAKAHAIPKKTPEIQPAAADQIRASGSARVRVYLYCDVDVSDGLDNVELDTIHERQEDLVSLLPDDSFTATVGDDPALAIGGELTVEGLDAIAEIQFVRSVELEVAAPILSFQRPRSRGR